MIALLALAAIAFPPTSVHVEGAGYLRLALDGRVVYAKSADLVEAGGQLADTKGAKVLPTVFVPEGATGIEVDPDGSLAIVLRAGKTKVGQLLLATFSGGDEPTSHGAYWISRKRPLLGMPGTEGFGTIATASPQIPSARPASDKADKSGKSEGPAKPTALANGRLKITLEPRAEIMSDHATLGAIAKIEGADDKHAADIDFGVLPPVGTTLRVTRERLLARLKSAGLTPSDYDLEGPPVTEIARKCQKVTQEQFVHAATSYVEASLGSPGTWTAAEPAPDVSAPIGAVSLKAESMRTFEGGASVVVALFVDGKRINSRTVKVASSSPPVEGVKAGSAVKVRFLISGILAEIGGRAKTAGYVGQTVQVLVSMTPGDPPTTHSGIVVAPGTVEVKL